jgi:hypothetical protein
MLSHICIRGLILFHVNIITCFDALVFLNGHIIACFGLVVYMLTSFLVIVLTC